MIFREALSSDIPQMQLVRNAVKENVLSDPSLIRDADYELYLTQLGNGWVCEIENHVVGFSVVDLKAKNVWALFVHPDFEKRGIGRQLHDVMLNWYFGKTAETIWLGTDPHSRAASFYRKAGWKEAGLHGRYEIKFELTFADWSERV